MSENTNITLRNQGYNDGVQGLEPVHPNSEPYMDGHNLGALVLQNEQHNRKWS